MIYTPVADICEEWTCNVSFLSVEGHKLTHNSANTLGICRSFQGAIQIIFCSRLSFHIRAACDDSGDNTAAGSLSWRVMVPSLEADTVERLENRNLDG